jgi:hypothetical protein
MDTGASGSASLGRQLHARPPARLPLPTASPMLSQMPAQPWEVPGPLGFIYGRMPLCPLLRPLLVPALAEVPLRPFLPSAPGVVVHTCGSSDRPLKIRKLRPQVCGDVTRQRAIRGWLEFILDVYPDSVVGRQLSLAEDKMQSLGHTLQDKSVSTLNVRLSSWRKLQAWCGMLQRTWPPDEDCVYAYVSIRHKYPTTPTSLVAAINFVFGTFGVASLQPLVESRRLAGAASSNLARLPDRKQALAMQPEDIAKLEDVVCSDVAPMQTKNIAFGCLVLAGFRGRFADLSAILEWLHGEQIVDIRMSTVKSARRDKSRLPFYMSGPRFLFTGQDWLAAHFKDREEAGISLTSFPPVPAFDGTSWSTQPAALADFNSALQALCSEIGISRPLERRSHSFKPCLLTLASQFGFNHTDRLRLGYHAIPGEPSTIRSYDRSMLREPLGKFIDAMDDFRRGEGCVFLATPIVVAQAPASDSEDSESSGSDTQPKQNKVADSRRFLNSLSHVLHAGRYGVSRKTACGKVIQAYYSKVMSAGQEYKYPYCKICFGARTPELPTSEGSDN